MLTARQAIALLEKPERLTAEDAGSIQATLANLNDQVYDFQQLAAAEQRLMRKATIAYKRAHHLPGPLGPSLAELLDWLMSRARVKETLEMEEALGKVLEQLGRLGELAYDETYNVSGMTLINLRVIAGRALAARQEAEVNGRDVPAAA